MSSDDPDKTPASKDPENGEKASTSPTPMKRLRHRLRIYSHPKDTA